MNFDWLKEEDRAESEPCPFCYKKDTGIPEAMFLNEFTFLQAELTLPGHTFILFFLKEIDL